MLAIVFFEIVFANLYALSAKLFWKAGKTSTKLGSIRYGRRWKLYLVQRSVHCTLSRQIKTLNPDRSLLSELRKSFSHAERPAADVSMAVATRSSLEHAQAAVCRAEFITSNFSPCQ